MSAFFKTCPHCRVVWQTLEHFLSDPQLKLAGYQVHFEDLKGGLFYFTHLSKNCGTTLSIPVEKFTGLSNRRILAAHGKQPDDCPNLCVRKESLDPCPAECECLWVREIMKIICDWKKRAA
ncbi:MAG: hypothetical protein WC047_04070 [Kiritimatiellales bacterium]